MKRNSTLKHEVLNNYFTESFKKINLTYNANAHINVNHCGTVFLSEPYIILQNIRFN